MNDYELVVREQKPVEGGSIFCEAKLVKRREDGSVWASLNLGYMYFVVDKNKRVIQHFNWLYKYANQVRALGYSMITTRERIVDLYLDYVNNYISLEAFSMDINCSEERASRIIDVGRILNYR